MEITRSSLLIVVYVAVAGSAPLKSSNRSLYVRSIPAIQDVSSNVYEVLMKPYTFKMHPLVAAAELNHVHGEEAKGALLFSQRFPPVGPVVITGNLTGLSPGKHVLYVHEWGDLRGGCNAAGPNFSPYQVASSGHTGELGQIVAAEDGSVQVHLRDDLFSLAGPRGIVGRAISVRTNPQDTGSPVACGVVGYTSPHSVTTR